MGYRMENKYYKGFNRDPEGKINNGRATGSVMLELQSLFFEPVQLHIRNLVDNRFPKVIVHLCHLLLFFEDIFRGHLSRQSKPGDSRCVLGSGSESVFLSAA